MLGRYAKREVMVEWKSDWRREQEARREAERLACMPVRAVKAVKPTKPKRVRLDKLVERKAGRPVKHLASTMKCMKCETVIRSDNTKGLCQKHSKELWNLSMKGKRGKKAA